VVSLSPMEKKFLEGLNQLLQAPKKIVVLPHRNPDGDALGSTLAWMHFLQAKGHQAVVISPNEYPSFLDWLPGQGQIIKFNQKTELALQHIEAADLIFTLDFNDLSRVEEMEAEVKAASAVKIMIDHHENPSDYATLMYSKPGMSSTCEMVYDLIAALDATAFNPEIANCLYTGIMTDTGSFRFPSTTSATHKAIAALIDAGAKGSDIHQQIYDTAHFSRIQLLGLTLSKIHKIEGTPVVYMYLTQEELNRFNYQKGDTEGFVNYGLNLEGIVFSAIMIENQREGKIKMSFRSQGAFSVNEFAKTYFSGGGHHNAAGGMSLTSMEDTIKRFEQVVLENKAKFE
jgi:bifunctional oligoribonuclease and PAP phosphatase NrnA